MSLLLAILAIGLLIVVHELGHFGAARALGMKVDSFSVGFGPSLVSFKDKRGTVWKLSMLPLGGYVQVAGMAPGDGTPEEEPRSFLKRPLWQRFLVIFAGPFTNWIFALVVLTGLMVVGYQRVADSTTLGGIADRSPAATAGLQAGDTVLAVDGQPVEGWSSLVAAIQAHKGQPLALTIDRQGREFTLNPTVGQDGLLGVLPSTELIRLPVGEATIEATKQTFRVWGTTLGALGKLVRREGGAQLMGPVGIVNATATAAKTGVQPLLSIMVLVSLALTLMNLLPLPGLDGGRLFFMGIELVRRKPVNPKAEAIVHGVGIALVILLLLVTTFTDVMRVRKSSATAPPPAAAPSSVDTGK